jgi:dTDP-4-amino-4,6-dideoxygalactose transaminase
MSALAAAMGMVSLHALPQVIGRRKAAARRIMEAAGQLQQLKPHAVLRGSNHNHYGLAFTSSSVLSRHFGATFLKDRGIHNDVIDYDLQPLNKYSLFRDVAVHGNENARHLADNLVMISPHHGLSPEDCQYIGATLAALDVAIQEAVAQNRLSE